MAYITLEESNELAIEHFGETPNEWSRLANTKATAFLERASSRMDSFPWITRSASAPQYPKTGETTVPLEVQRACFELALFYYKNIDISSKRLPTFGTIGGKQDTFSPLHPSLLDIPTTVQSLVQALIVKEEVITPEKESTCPQAVTFVTNRPDDPTITETIWDNGDTTWDDAGTSWDTR